jgi:hypothetical protein
MPAEATVATPIPTEVAAAPSAAAEVPAVLLGTQAPAPTADQAAATEAAAAKAATDAQAATDAAKVTADAKLAADALAAKGAPDKYEFKAPEGTAYDSNLLAAFEAGAKEANLPQVAAQKLLDQMAPALASRQADQVTAIRKEWFDASKADKEFGGDKLEVNLGTAKRGLDSFGSPELNKLLVSTGLGNHPEIIRLMFKVGQAISEDKFVAGSAPRSSVSAASVLYDKSQPAA